MHKDTYTITDPESRAFQFSDQERKFESIGTPMCSTFAPNQLEKVLPAAKQIIETALGRSLGQESQLKAATLGDGNLERL